MRASRSASPGPARPSANRCPPLRDRRPPAPRSCRFPRGRSPRSARRARCSGCRAGRGEELLVRPEDRRSRGVERHQLDAQDVIGRGIRPGRPRGPESSVGAAAYAPHRSGSAPADPASGPRRSRSRSRWIASCGMRMIAPVRTSLLLPVAHDQPARQSELPIQPAVEQRTAVDLGAQLLPTERCAIGVRLEHESRRVGVGTDDPRPRGRSGVRRARATPVARRRGRVRPPGPVRRSPLVRPDRRSLPPGAAAHPRRRRGTTTATRRRRRPGRRRGRGLPAWAQLIGRSSSFAYALTGICDSRNIWS